MITLCINRTVPLPCGIHDIKGVAINGCDFFFLENCKCNIIKWNIATQAIEVIPLMQKYRCLCFDDKECCYWAIPEREPNRIYRLNLCFRELAYTTINGDFQQCPSGLCCDGCKEGLWISYPSQLAFWDKFSKKMTWYKNDDSQRMNLGIIVQSGCRMACYYEGNRHFIEAVLPCQQDSIELCISKHYQLVGMAPYHNKQKCNACHFCVVLSKCNSHELVLTEYCIDLNGQPNKCCCGSPCPPSPCPPLPPLPPCGGSYEIMHSIALEEAGISHILNAEGEKIQKAVAISNSIDELLCVNKSVKHTLTQVTLLEGMLYSKLETLLACNDFCHSPKPPSPLPCICDKCKKLPTI